MKILTIESPQRLKDRTVKAVITVSEDDYIPLIMLADRIYKGEEGRLDIAEKENQEGNPYSQLKERFMSAFDALIREIKEIHDRERQEEVEGLLSPEKDEA